MICEDQTEVDMRCVLLLYQKDTVTTVIERRLRLKPAEIYLLTPQEMSSHQCFLCTLNQIGQSHKHYIPDLKSKIKGFRTSTVKGNTDGTESR